MVHNKKRASGVPFCRPLFVPYLQRFRRNEGKVEGLLRSRIHPKLQDSVLETGLMEQEKELVSSDEIDQRPAAEMLCSLSRA